MINVDLFCSKPGLWVLVITTSLTTQPMVKSRNVKTTYTPLIQSSYVMLFGVGVLCSVLHCLIYCLLFECKLLAD